MKRLLSILISFTACTALSAQEPSLEALQKIYTHAMAKIDTQYQEKLKPLKNTYYQNLIKYLSQVKAKGDLKALVEVKAEEKRFLKENTVPANPAGGKNATIVKIQQSFNTSAKATTQSKNKQVMKLMGLYIKRLDDLKNTYVRQEKIELGRAVMTESNRVKNEYSQLKADFAIRVQVKPPSNRVSRPPLPPFRVTPSLKKDLVLHYTFDAHKKGVVSDQSSSRNNGVATEVEWIPNGVQKGAYSFTNEHSHIVSKRSLPISGDEPRTISIWFSLRSAQPQVSLFGWGKKENTKLSIVRLTKDKGQRLVFHGYFQDMIQPVQTFKFDEWYHLVMTYHDTDLSFYINGKQTAQVSRKLNTAKSRFHLGEMTALLDKPISQSFNGRIDEVMAWERVLSQAEITDLYNQQGVHVITPSVAPPPRERGPMKIPKDAIVFNGHHYKVFKGNITWTEAQKQCEALGGYLACIESPRENTFVTSLVPEKPVYLGGSDKEEEGVWRWLSDEPFVYRNWGSGEPSNGGGAEDYSWLRADGSWNDIPSRPRDAVDGYICEWDQ